MTENYLLTESEASMYLSMSKSWLRKCRCFGHGGPNYLKISRSIRYRVSDLDEYLESKQRKGVIFND